MPGRTRRVRYCNSLLTKQKREVIRRGFTNLDMNRRNTATIAKVLPVQEMGNIEDKAILPAIKERIANNVAYLLWSHPFYRSCF